MLLRQPGSEGTPGSGDQSLISPSVLSPNKIHKEGYSGYMAAGRALFKAPRAQLGQSAR